MTLQNLLIRDETPGDVAAIHAVTVAAFESLEISGHTEQYVIEALRSAQALTLPLVAEVDGRVVGHIAFSPVTLSDGTQDWYGLGPVSVLPSYQQMGIGKALIWEGLSRLKELGAKGCCLVGHPQYYRKFGFENVPGLTHDGVPPEVFFALAFDGRYPQGTVTFHAGFQAAGPAAPAGEVSAPPSKEERSPTRRGRGCMIWLAGVLAGLLILLVVGAIYEPVAEAAEAKANPPPGKMVDVGGYRLHIHCSGSGIPTVVVEAGWGESSATWGWVQPEVARTTRICTYDRAGMGWSEASPQPRTAREFAKELHTLLANANETGPYVLVGHSLGGFTMLVYAHDYPAEVSGLVLVDAQALPSSDAAAYQPAPQPGGTSLPALLARAGLVRLLAGPLGLIQNLPEADQQAYKASSVTPRSVQTFLDEGRGMAEGGAQARAVTSLGALPLIVLSRGKDQDADWAASQAGFLELSTNSRQVFAGQSGHSIHIEQPEAVVAAIVKMVAQLRK